MSALQRNFARTGKATSHIVARHFGNKAHPTVHTSAGDKALGLSEWLMGSLRRMGRVDQASLDKVQVAKSRALAGFATFVQVTDTAGFIGHSYFVSDPAVSADLMSLVRYGLAPSDPGCPLEEASRPFWKIAPARNASE